METAMRGGALSRGANAPLSPMKAASGATARAAKGKTPRRAAAATTTPKKENKPVNSTPKTPTPSVKSTGKGSITPRRAAASAKLEASTQNSGKKRPMADRSAAQSRLYGTVTPTTSTTRTTAAAQSASKRQKLETTLQQPTTPAEEQHDETMETAAEVDELAAWQGLTAPASDGQYTQLKEENDRLSDEKQMLLKELAEGQRRSIQQVGAIASLEERLVAAESSLQSTQQEMIAAQERYASEQQRMNNEHERAASEANERASADHRRMEGVYKQEQQTLIHIVDELQHRDRAHTAEIAQHEQRRIEYELLTAQCAEQQRVIEHLQQEQRQLQQSRQTNPTILQQFAHMSNEHLALHNLQVLESKLVSMVDEQTAAAAAAWTESSTDQLQQQQSSHLPLGQHASPGGVPRAKCTLPTTPAWERRN